MNTSTKKVLLAGIGPGSLGLELLKCLNLDSSIAVYGADINPTAYGLSDPRFEKTYIVESRDEKSYCQELLNICKHEDIGYLAPGAEATNRILCANQDEFKDNEVFPLVNSQNVYNICSDKIKCNTFLASKGLPSLETIYIPKEAELDLFEKFPCVVKPASESGGSNMVFLAENLK